EPEDPAPRDAQAPLRAAAARRARPAGRASAPRPVRLGAARDGAGREAGHVAPTDLTAPTASATVPARRAAMKLFIDTADVGEIREAHSWGVLDGVTTNPSLVAKTGRDFETVLREICGIVDGPVSAEVVS